MYIKMYIQRHIYDYLPFFLVFVILTIILGLIFFNPLVSSERNKFLKDSFMFCFVLSFLTVAGDFFIFPNVSMIKTYIPYMGVGWSIVAVPIAYLWCIISFAGLFLVLRSIPFCGKTLQWLMWLLLTIPARLYYFVTNVPPTYTDILNLLNVRIETTLDTILPVLTPEIIFKACLPNIIILIIMIVLKLPQPKIASQKFQRVLAFSIGALIFTGYVIDPRGEYLRQDSMTYSMKVFRETYKNLSEYILYISQNDTQRAEFTYVKTHIAPPPQKKTI